MLCLGCSSLQTYKCRTEPACEDRVHARRRRFARHGYALSASTAVQMTTCRLS